MKYGEHLEEESVPGWSLHNIDYNSLKYQIKTHTTKDQATAIAIPGQQDYALKRFEDAFYLELCNQHNRVSLFVTSKADEIARRLRHLSDSVHQLIVRCNEAGGVSPKRQRRLAKYALQIDECEDDIKALRRFVSAQVIAFRKILKKYRKWTGSTTLSTRFKENVLSSPKSFMRRDFHPLQSQHQELLATLEAASPDMNSLQAECQKQKQKAKLQFEQRNSSRRPSQTSKPPSVISTPGGSSGTYWNEYEHGSEAGDNDEGAYALYIDPNASSDFPGFVYMKYMFTAPVDIVRHWLKARTPQTSETQPLINGQTPVDYFSTRHSSTAGTTDNDATEDEYASSLNSSIGRRNKLRYAALPETEADQDYQITLYRDKVLTRTVVIAFIAAFILLIISGVLIATGKHKLRLEVDAGVTVGSVASLFCACMGLGAMLYRHYPVGIMYSLAVWAAFIAVCTLNGMLLVLVVGSSGL
ncbi:hypothetical protein F4820DRAFT_432583 [Hypoxylon rubiginosum]|uniref:Uncharacterized protein n=1 Tax=Hypoxylon rubiginosum TaxID=110542 RepID=A0ACB9YQS3_9PEZI|nr:hypothetical protein F4820DRAFT_432583 [Hypoxylon rubiginosum]